MNEATIAAMLNYLEALKAEGFKCIHLGMVIPVNGPQTSLERHKAGLPRWTQFPDITIPETMGKYDRSSGFVFFDLDLYEQSRQKA